MLRLQEPRAQRLAWLLGAFLLAALETSSAQVLNASPCADQASTGLASVETQVQEVRAASFPELTKTDVRLRPFHSKADYFRTRFSLSRFLLLRRMRYFVEVNPTLFDKQAPSDGVCGVLAHELSHVVALSRGNRIRRLSLIRLLSIGYTAQFERKTDLEAIHRGSGDGLKSYRTWVYAHIPASALPAKRRNYFSPEEIEAIQQRLRGQPGLFAFWKKHAPRNLAEIERSP
jgi:hypothetical protein